MCEPRRGGTRAPTSAVRTTRVVLASLLLVYGVVGFTYVLLWDMSWYHSTFHGLCRRYGLFWPGRTPCQGLDQY